MKLDLYAPADALSDSPRPPMPGHWLDPALVFAVTALVLALLSPHYFANIFFERDLARSQEILKGAWIFEGPEVMRGGFLPGAFLYYFQALALLIWNDWKSVLALLILCQSTATALAFQILRPYSRTIAYTFALTYALGSFTFVNFRYLFNPCFLPLFLFSLLLALESALSAPDRKSRHWAGLAGALAGLSLQIHGFGLCFIALGVYALFRSPKKLKFYGLGLAFVFLPFVLLKLLHFGSALPEFGTLLVHSRAFSELVTYSARNVQLLGIDTLQNLLEVFFPGLFFLAFARRPRAMPLNSLERFSIVLSGLSLPAALYFLFTDFGPRYALVFQLSFAFYGALRLARSKAIHRKWIGFFALLLCLALNFWIARPRLNHRFADWRFVAQEMVRLGFPTYAQARSSIFTININGTEGFRFLFEEAQKSISPEGEPPLGVILRRANGRGFSGVERQGILTGKIPELTPELLRWQAAGHIALEPPIFSPNKTLALIAIRRGPNYGTTPLRFGNMGLTFLREMPPSLTPGAPIHPFPLAGLPSTCGFGAAVIPAKNEGGVKVELTGLSLSFNTPNYYPECTGLIQSLYAEWDCTGKLIREPLAEKVGLAPPILPANSVAPVLLTPLALTVPVPAPTKAICPLLRSLALGYENGNFDGKNWASPLSVGPGKISIPAEASWR